MRLGGYNKLTLLDYPDKLACVVFTDGCNLRCPFCHNAALVTSGDASADEAEFFAFLRKRRNLLEGVCVSGGEPLIHADLPDFLRRIKDLGYSVKLDTNGCFPDRLRELVSGGVVDYVAMDVKNSRDKYGITCGVPVDVAAVERTVELLKSGIVDYEFRTTVTATFHTQADMAAIGEWLRGAKRYYLQQFVDSGGLIDPTVTGCDVATLKMYLRTVRQYVPCAQLRGVG